MKITIILFAVLMAGCSQDNSVNKSENIVAIDAPDVGNVTSYFSCKSEARRDFSTLDKCRIKKLSARCSQEDDCMVSCLSSPDGYKVGGGCDHVCFTGPHKEIQRPPGWDECK